MLLKVNAESPEKVRLMQWEKIGGDLCLDMAEFCFRSKRSSQAKTDAHTE